MKTMSHIVMHLLYFICNIFPLWWLELMWEATPIVCCTIFPMHESGFGVLVYKPTLIFPFSGIFQANILWSINSCVVFWCFATCLRGRLLGLVYKRKSELIFCLAYMFSRPEMLFLTWRNNIFLFFFTYFCNS